MSIAGLVLLLVFAVGAVLFIAWPFLAGNENTVRERPTRINTRLQQLQDEREAVLITMRDLDFDYRTGKLTEGDYNAQRELLVQRGVTILKQIDMEKGIKPQVVE